MKSITKDFSLNKNNCWEKSGRRDCSWWLY